MQQEWIIAATFGGILVLTGVLLLRAHSETWKKHQADPELEEEELRHYRSRYRRRMQAAVLLIMIGVLIPLGDAGIPWENMQKRTAGYLWAFYWMGVIFLTLWVAALGLGDFASTTVHAKNSMARIRTRQRQLEQELARIRQQERKAGNGRHDHQSQNEPKDQT